LPDTSVWRKGRSIVRWAYRRFPSPTVRERAIMHLRRHPAVITEFLIREHGVGAVPVSELSREAFLRNIVNTDYNLCARGRGNWSIRFYETLSLGRIPLFIDTECALPYDFEVKYQDYCVWVDDLRLENIGDQLLAFHNSLDSAGFKDLQRECRRLWEQRLSPHGFFSHFHEHFKRS
ncbi:MAG: hypothetical protein ACREA0_03570, partial [bacterium]